MTTMKTLFARILGISSRILNFFIPILKKIVADGLEDLLPIALAIVADLARRDTLSGKEKFEEAVQKLSSHAQEYGLQASASIINFAVEAAVQKLKEGGR